MRTQLDVLRAMTPEQRLAAAMQLWHQARALKEAAVRAKHPDWSPDRVRRAVNEWLLYART